MDNATIEKIAKSACTSVDGRTGLVGKGLVVSAIREALRAFAEEEPTGKVIGAAIQTYPAHDTLKDLYSAAYRAMMTEKLKELEKPHEG